MTAHEIFSRTYQANYQDSPVVLESMASLVRATRLARKAVLETAPVTTASEVRDACATVIDKSNFRCETIKMAAGRLSILAGSYYESQPFERRPWEVTPEWLEFERRVAQVHGTDFTWAFGECSRYIPRTSTPSRAPALLR